MQIAVGACDAISARVIDRIERCNALWISSFELSTSAGLADRDTLTLQDLESRLAAVSRASTKPILLDASNAEAFGVANLVAWAKTLRRETTLVVDDTKYPRENSFTSRTNQILTPSDIRQRLQVLLDDMRFSSHLHLCFRTEYYRHSGDLLSTLLHVEAVVDGFESPLDSVLIHGYDTVKLGIQDLRRHLGPLKLMTLSTLSPGSKVSEFSDQGVDTLVIPSILTIQRQFDGQELISDILGGRYSVDGPYPPFADIAGELEFQNIE